MSEMLWVGSILLFIAWLAPLLLLLQVSFSLSPRFEQNFGLWQLSAAVGLVFLPVLFIAWWYVRLGRFTDWFFLVLHVVFLIAAVVGILAGRLILHRLEEFGQIPEQRTGRHFFTIVLIVSILITILAILYSNIKPVTVYTLFGNIVYCLGIGLFGSLYIVLGLFTRLLRRDRSGSRQYFAYMASGAIFAYALLRMHYLSYGDQSIWLSQVRPIVATGMALGAVLLYLSVNPVANELVLRMRKEWPEAPFERRKALTQKRFVIVFLIVVIFSGIAGILMLEEIRSDEKIIQTAYLDQQRKVAESAADNVNSLANDLVGVLQQLAGQPAIVQTKSPGMEKLFLPLIIKWDWIVDAFARVDTNGIIQYAYPEVPGVIRGDISQESHVKSFLRNRDFLISGPFDAVQGNQAVAIYVPVFSKDNEGKKVFAGGMAMLININAFSLNAFRNISILNPHPVAAVNLNSIVFSESRNTYIGKSAEEYLGEVFKGRAKEKALGSLVQRILQASSPASIPVEEDRYVGMISEWIVAVPIEFAAHRFGEMIVPIHSDDIVRLYRQGTSHQIELWASLVAIFIGMTLITLIMHRRWSTFLELEIKRERDLVRKTEGRYTKLVSDALVGIFEAKPDGELISVNPAMVRLLDYASADELVGRKILEAAELSRQANVEAGSKPAPDSPLRLEKKDGTPVYVRLSCRAGKGAGGEVLRYEGFIEDMTEQYLAHTRLEESEKRYSEIFELSPAGIYVSTIDGKILEANDSLAKIFGYDKSEEVLRLPAAVFYTEPALRGEFINELKRHGTVVRKISIGRKKDGSKVYVLENSELSFDPSYDREVIRGALMDITELVILQQEVELHRRTAEATSQVLVAAFEESELGNFINRSLSSIGNKLDLYAALLVKKDGGVLESDHEWYADSSAFSGKIKVSSAFLESLFNDGSNVFASDVSRQELGNGYPGPRMGSRFATSLREGPAKVFGHRPFAVSLVKLKDEVCGSIILVADDGQRKWTAPEKELLSSVSKIVATIVERHTEASIRRGLEEERRRLFFALEQLAESVAVADVNGVIQYVNSTFTKITGFTREEAIGKSTSLLKSGAHSQKFYKRLWDTVLSGNTFKARFTNKRKDGTIFYEDKTIAPVIDSDGKVISFLEVGNDVTEQISIEEQLAQSQKLESIGLLAGGIAHDFNNIIGAILGYASFMKNKISGDHQFYKYLDTIERSAVRAAELTSQLLAFARGGKYNVTPVNLNMVVLDTLGIVRSTIDRSITVRKNLSEDLPTVEADPGQMQQVVMNLCVNARDAMSAGGFLTIETSEVTLTEDDAKSNIEARPGSYVLLAVSDTGIGMDKITAQRIFEPFFTTKEKGKGTGLGLSMVYGIVRNHGGFVKVESEPGKGTTFKVFYPASGKPEKEEARTMNDVKGGTETILLAEDEEAMRELVVDVLESGGYKVIATDNGEAAVKVYSSRKDEIDLVILDMIMPKLNGGDAFRELKKVNPNILVLLSSGYSQDEKAQQLLNEGVAGFLGKPYQVRELLEKVRVVLENRKCV